MLKIREIHIRNFRSIVNQTILTNDMNVFVGLNDVGKSNILKALNLFFNGETDVNKQFDFESDYSKLAPERINKAREIIVTLKIEVPEHYADGGTIQWKKIWRSGYTGTNPFHNKFVPFGRDFEPEQPFSLRSKTPTALKRMKYYYIPAVKSTDYFKHLLGSLYESAATSVDSALATQSREYSNALKTFTARISQLVKEKIGIESVLTMPENQMDIFKELAFGTKDAKNNDVLLDYRGDGVKARHIPAILKFIEEHDLQAGANSIPYTVLWGYEEPENGVEMLKCFDLAMEFYNYSSEIQLFITTHSPAFYSQSELPRVKVLSVSQNENGDTKIDSDVEISKIDETIGLLPIITPYINQQVATIKEYEHIFKDNYLTDIDTIIVEGKTDREYMTNAIKALSPDLAEKLDNATLRILTKEESCGVKQLHDWTLAWCLAGFNSKLVALFDSDGAGEEWIDRLRSNDIYTSKKKNKPTIQKLMPSEKIIELRGMDIALPFCIEHLFPIEIWSEAHARNLLAERDILICHEMLQNLVRFDNTIESIINDLWLEDGYKEHWIRKTIKSESSAKTSFANIVRQSTIQADILYAGFQNTVSKLESKFA